MEPTIGVNYLAVLACVILGMFVGFLWFGPLFGKAWARHMGMQDMPQPSGGEMGRSMLIFAIGNVLIAFVLAHSLEVWRPSVWGLSGDQSASVYALNGAFFTWIGFFIPLQMGRVAWERKGWGLVAINASFDLVRLLIFAFVLAYWR